MEIEQTSNITRDIVVEVAKDLYSDAAKPAMLSTGQVIGLVPRAIRAACSGLEKWILTREYSVAETEKLLEEKLRNISPDNIVPPDPHVAVPALQYISYCMDNEVLRDMYANLLANAMNKIVKNGVHPGFVEIIKQICPDEAKILKTIYISKKPVPTVSIMYINDKGSQYSYLTNYSNIGEISGCECIYETDKYFDNLHRLGLIDSKPFSALANKEVYKTLESHPYIKLSMDKAKLINDGSFKPEIKQGYYELTAYGRSFCSICMTI